jgi:hypothetical protein
MLLRIRGTGEAEEMLVKPETAYALCQRVIVVLEKFGKPPGARYWVKVDIGKRKGNP